ncbi:PHP domain-like protein [Suhomyces tanzawaensis NRRL Y-17324]|uniref:PHP domain-like protein n=1 Tax=Suhomyces tanzawaensis NRRL Y-17324 TaxID=984487 RepID=A0A1E4SLJ6_9ASCO|nr:PHP domain-like protein [Suhomyces tanzawaensis NRRL Y-17324]ODV80384.1 PHP domain-like protein [Suhomyces tanzawaensis NRRL Y-17324]
MLYDLNVPWPSNGYSVPATPSQTIGFKNTIVTLYTLGYRQIAINFQLQENVKLPINQPERLNPIPMNTLRDDLCEKFPGLKLYSRVTLIVNDPSKCQGLAKLQGHFDILAVQPTSEKALQLCTINLDIDLISFNFATKLPFFIKHKTVGSAVDKGIKFEICYATVVAGYGADLGINSQMIRKNFFSNVLQLIRGCRSRGIIVSSGATLASQVRNSGDVLTILKTVGLDNSRAKACVTLSPERVLVNGRLRVRSYKQTILEGNDGDLVGSEDVPSKKRLADSSSGRLLKKARKGE